MVVESGIGEEGVEENGSIPGSSINQKIRDTILINPLGYKGLYACSGIPM
jgi:hypothetical protein